MDPLDILMSKVGEPVRYSLGSAALALWPERWNYCGFLRTLPILTFFVL